MNYVQVCVNMKIHTCAKTSNIPVLITTCTAIYKYWWQNNLTNLKHNFKTEKLK